MRRLIGFALVITEAASCETVRILAGTAKPGARTHMAELARLVSIDRQAQGIQPAQHPLLDVMGRRLGVSH